MNVSCLSNVFGLWLDLESWMVEKWLDFERIWPHHNIEFLIEPAIDRVTNDVSNHEQFKNSREWLKKILRQFSISPRNKYQRSSFSKFQSAVPSQMIS